MSEHNIRPFFQFKRVKIHSFGISRDAKLTQVKLEPDRRFLPICSGCKKRVHGIHSYEYRAVRDLSMIESIVTLILHYRKVRCPDCGIRVEYHDFVAPYARYTHRLAQYVFELCKYMTVTDVASLLHLSWHQVKEIDKSELRKRYSNPDYSNVRILSVDEISIRKHHHYLTIICNFETGEVIAQYNERGGHTGVMVPVFTFGPGAEKFQGIQENTDLFFKMMAVLGITPDD